MKFDKSRVYTTLNADELKVGSKVIVANNLEFLKTRVAAETCQYELKAVLTDDCEYRFKTEGEPYALAYLVEEPRALRWIDLKVGDVIHCGKVTAVVNAINEEEGEQHILAGDVWLDNSDIRYWEKVK